MLTTEGLGFLGAVVDEDGTVNHIQSLSLEALSRLFLKPNYTHPELAALRNAVGEIRETELGQI